MQRRGLARQARLLRDKVVVKVRKKCRVTRSTPTRKGLHGGTVAQTRIGAQLFFSFPFFLFFYDARSDPGANLWCWHHASSLLAAAAWSPINMWASRCDPRRCLLLAIHSQAATRDKHTVAPLSHPDHSFPIQRNKARQAWQKKVDVSGGNKPTHGGTEVRKDAGKFDFIYFWFYFWLFFSEVAKWCDSMFLRADRRLSSVPLILYSALSHRRKKETRVTPAVCVECLP